MWGAERERERCCEWEERRGRNSAAVGGMDLVFVLCQSHGVFVSFAVIWLSVFLFSLIWTVGLSWDVGEE